MSDNKHAAFNKFQTMFYTSIDGLNNYTNYEFKQHTFTLLHNLSKGFPLLAVMMTNVYSSEFMKFDECPSLIKALQRKFVNGFSNARMPKHVYYASGKAAKVAKTKTKRKPNGALDFEDDVKFQIKSILMYDEKTYEYLKYSKKVQELGNEIIKEFNKKEVNIFKSKTQ